MDDSRLANLLDDLLSDDEALSQGPNEELSLNLDSSLETQLFNEAELEAALGHLNDVVHETPPQLLPNPPENSSEKPSIPNEEANERYPELKFIEAAVRQISSKGNNDTTSSVLERIRNRLMVAEETWNPEGRPDARGGMIGGTIALRIAATSDPLSKALQNEARYGTTLVIAERNLKGTIWTAVGTSRSIVVVQSVTTTVHGTPYVELFELGDGRPAGTLTCLTFSHPSDLKLLLATGNDQGLIAIWDLQGKRCIAIVTGHTSVIFHLEFLAGKSAQVLVSSDAKGALHYHTLTSWMVRTTVSTKFLSEGNKQPMLFHFFPSHEHEETSITTTPMPTFGEGMVALCHPGVCNIGRLTSEGRLIVFYQIPKPTHIETDVMPIAIWAPLSNPITFAAHPNRDIDRRIPLATLALCWNSQVSLLSVPLLGDPTPDMINVRHFPQQLGSMDWVKLAHELQITSLASWNAPGNQEGNILFASWLPENRLGIFRRRGILAQFLMFDHQMQLMDQVEIDDFPLSQILRKEPSELVSLINTISTIGSNITILGGMAVKRCRLLEWSEAISILVDIEKSFIALHLLVAFYCQATRQEYPTRLGKAQLGRRLIGPIHQNFAQVLVRLVDTMLDPKHTEEIMPISHVAELTIDVCVLIQRSDVLFDDLFPRFVSFNVEEAFLDKLERSLTSNALKARIPPEVMQRLIEYCCSIGEPEKVERCVLKMDISSLDLNQVIPLCVQHHLFTALLFIYNHSLLQDCTTPARQLVSAICFAEDPGEVNDYGMKLLLYLRCCLLGESYPPGTEEVDEERAEKTKRQILGFIFFTKADDLHKCQIQDRSLKDENQSIFLSDPYPVFRCLLSIHASLVFRLLKDALDEWDCMEKDLWEAFIEGSVEEMEQVRSVTQVIVDALLELLSTSGNDQNEWMDFISHSVASGRAIVSPTTALVLLDHLSSKPKNSPQEEYIESEEERNFCGIIRSIGVELDASKLSTNRFTYLQGQNVLGMALNRGWLVAASFLYHLFRDYKAALEYRIKAGNTESGSCFSYFEQSMAHFAEFQNTTELQKMKSAVLSCMSDLANLDPEGAASMVMRHFPNDQEVVIHELHGSRNLLFKYLKSSMDAYLSQSQVALSTDVNQLLTKSHCTLYVNLMCEFDPSNVLPFLKTFDHLVDVEECKKDCLAFGLRDAAAHLLEREGDVIGALHVLIEKIKGSHGAMEKAILSRSLDSLEDSLCQQQSLPAVLRVSNTPDVRLRRLPTEVGNAQASLTSAVLLCRRNALDREHVEQGDEKRREETVRLWFALLSVYVDFFRNLPNLMKKTKKSTQVPSGFYHKGIIKRNDLFREYPRLAFLRDIYTAMMDEVVTDVANYIPLTEVAEWMIKEHGQDRLCDFRSMIVSLIHAYDYEQTILTSIGRLLSTDAFRALLSYHKKRSKAISNASIVPQTNVL